MFELKPMDEWTAVCVDLGMRGARASKSGMDKTFHQYRTTLVDTFGWAAAVPFCAC